GPLVFAADVRAAREAALAIAVAVAAAPVGGGAARAPGVVEEGEKRLVAEVFDEKLAPALGDRTLAPGVLVSAHFALGRAPTVDDGATVERFELVARQRDDPLDEVLLGA